MALLQALQRLPDPCHSAPRQSLPRILETNLTYCPFEQIYVCVCGFGRVVLVREGAAYKTCIASSKEGIEGNCTFEVSSRVLVFLEVHEGNTKVVARNSIAAATVDASLVCCECRLHAA